MIVWSGLTAYDSTEYATTGGMYNLASGDSWTAT
jgi:hypothetical protein